MSESSITSWLFFALSLLIKLISRATVNSRKLSESFTAEPVIKGSTVMNCLSPDAPTLVTATLVPLGGVTVHVTDF